MHHTLALCCRSSAAPLAPPAPAGSCAQRSWAHSRTLARTPGVRPCQRSGRAPGGVRGQVLRARKRVWRQGQGGVHVCVRACCCCWCATAGEPGSAVAHLQGQQPSHALHQAGAVWCARPAAVAHQCKCMLAGLSTRSAQQRTPTRRRRPPTACACVCVHAQLSTPHPLMTLSPLAAAAASVLQQRVRRRYAGGCVAAPPQLLQCARVMGACAQIGVNSDPAGRF
jgi:hypothetical protein